MSASFTFSIKLVSPFMTGAGGASPFGLDAALPRRGKRPYINGTLLRGVLRDALISMLKRTGGSLPGVDAENAEDLVATLFGRQSGAKSAFTANEFRDDANGNAPERGALVIGDLIATTDPDQDDTLTRISIDEGSGSVREGHMQVLDLPYPIGREVEFEGKAFLRAKADVEQVEQVLNLALQALGALGAHKSAGFGRVASYADEKFHPQARVVACDSAPHKPQFFAETKYVSLTLKFDGPFLVDADRVAANLYRGSVVVPGGVLKGALADALAKVDLLGRHADMLERVVFGHARPWDVPNPEQPQAKKLEPSVPPYSVCVFEGQNLVVDLAMLSTPALGPNGAAPKFEVDWKRADRRSVAAAMRDTGRISVDDLGAVFSREIRTRTAIDYDTGTAFQDNDGGKLFTYSLVEPGEHQWKSVIGAPADVKTEAFLDFLKTIASRPFFFGKHKTRATVEFVEDDDEPDVPELGDAVALVLQTPGLLTPLSALRKTSGDVEKAYAAYFKALVEPHGLVFSHCYARQEYRGGYLGMRYRESVDVYEPHLVSLPGSVFVFKVTKAKTKEASKRVQSLLRDGLPPAGGFSAPHWKTCPFPRENGYGAVRLWKPVGKDAAQLKTLQRL